MKSAIIILGSAVLVAADANVNSGHQDVTVVPTDGGQKYATNGDAQTGGGAISNQDVTGKMAVINNQNDNGDDGYNLNNIEARYDAKTSTDLTALFQQGELLESIRSTLQISVNNCQDTKLKLEQQAQDIQTKMDNFENTLGAMNVVVQGNGAANQLSGLSGAQTALGKLNKFAAQLSLQVKTVWDKTISKGFGVKASAALLKYTEMNPVDAVANVEASAQSECAEPKAMGSSVEAVWAWLQSAPCKALANINAVNSNFLGYGTDGFQAGLMNGDINSKLWWTNWTLSVYEWDTAMPVNSSENSSTTSIDTDLAIPKLTQNVLATPVTADLFNKFCSFMAISNTAGASNTGS